MSETTAYEGLLDDSGDLRWAYGTGFADPLAGVDTELPSDVDGAALGAYCVALGDDALVLSHRLQEWVTRAPELEEETALANIALDLLGQARLLFTRAGQVDGTGRTEDDFAFGRLATDFGTVLLVEGVDADFAGLVTRLLVFSTWRLALFEALRTSRDPALAAIATKGVNELAYHRDYAAQWVLRLGDGTSVSHARTEAGLDAAWPMMAELFASTPLERGLASSQVGADPGTLRDGCGQTWDAVLEQATLRPRVVPDAGEPRGRLGNHGDDLLPLLEELQSVARALPGARW